MDRALTLALALAIDRAAGDPPTRLHPVGALGSLARVLEALAPRGAGARRAYGLGVAVALPLLAALAASGLPGLPGLRRGPARTAADAGLLSLGFALRTLLDRVREVEDALRRGDTAEARSLLARHLVSRDVSELGPGELAGAAIESLAENLSDSVIAPWLWYAAGGLPAAWAYRASNTLDALWGYRDERYRDLGEAAARASFAVAGSLMAVCHAVAARSATAFTCAIAPSLMSMFATLVVMRPALPAMLLSARVANVASVATSPSVSSARLSSAVRRSRAAASTMVAG